MQKKFYVTTTLPYVNADPHIGFAMEIIRADTLGRYHRLLGEEVIFNTGTDEHGQKIFQKAEEEKISPQEYCDRHVKNYRKLKVALGLSYTNFIRTTDSHHLKAAQEFWKRCHKDIYKAKYQIKYCIGCELEKTESELVDNRCPIHPNLPLEIREEDNYFFKFSKYQKPLLELYQSKPDFVVPGFRQAEITNFVKKGLNDFSISRLKEKMPWGIDVPGDPGQVMYVWFDALINYISTLGWPEDEKNFKQFWPGVQIAGKDNLRQQSAMWQAMLLSAGLPPSKQIYIEGFITAGGQKISKSLGNVIDPLDLVKRYGTDPLRYYLLREIPAYDDGDFSISRFKELYNADLANGLGNLVSRVAKLCEKSGFDFNKKANLSFDKYVIKLLNGYRFGDALARIWEHIHATDKIINEQKPWEQKGETLRKSLQALATEIQQIAFNLKPFLPQTAEKIENQFEGPKIKSENPLFPRLEAAALTQKPHIQKGKIVIGKIVELAPHPNADKLKVAKVDIGLPILLTIVCGAPNIKKGQVVPVALSGSEINQPNGKNIKVKRGNLRGIRSEAVICSKLEAGTGKEYEEIWVLNNEEEKNLGRVLS